MLVFFFCQQLTEARLRYYFSNIVVVGSGGNIALSFQVLLCFVTMHSQARTVICGFLVNAIVGFNVFLLFSTITLFQ